MNLGREVTKAVECGSSAVVIEGWVAPVVIVSLEHKEKRVFFGGLVC